MDGSVTVKQRALVAAHAEIARLRAEVEGWRVIASENHAALAALTEIEANMDQQDAEIARLRAENERLTAIVTDDNGPWRLEAAKKRIAELEAEIARLTEERDEALKRKET
jgi:predicted nuclease with TOPRIM domain